MRSLNVLSTDRVFNRCRPSQDDARSDRLRPLRRGERMVTIRDVAARAQVSVATVSHVMNESRFVSPETKERVQAAMLALNYRRDGIARSLRRNRTGTIGVIISDISNPFFSGLVKGIEAKVNAQAERLDIILCNTDEDAAKERHYVDVLLEKRVDGIIMAPSGEGHEEVLRRLVETGFPLVFVDRSLASVEADRVMVDNRAASTKLVHHLIDRGHRRIAVLQATLHADSIAQRVAGYREAIEAAGIGFDPNLIVAAASDIDAAERAGQTILDLEPRPEAVFCTNNFMTLGLMRALNARGLRTPRDLAIAGFDDFQWADSFRPRITAVAQPSREMGVVAATLLLDRITRTHTGPAVEHCLQTELVIRESSG